MRRTVLCTAAVLACIAAAAEAEQAAPQSTAAEGDTLTVKLKATHRP
jgi:hypothetical protein